MLVFRGFGSVIFIQSVCMESTDLLDDILAATLNVDATFLRIGYAAVLQVIDIGCSGNRCIQMMQVCLGLPLAVKLDRLLAAEFRPCVRFQ